MFGLCHTFSSHQFRRSQTLFIRNSMSKSATNRLSSTSIPLKDQHDPHHTYPSEFYHPCSTFLKTMEERGFFHQCTNIEALDQYLLKPGGIGYLGFDATASSLHVGSLLQIMILRHFQKCGHKPVVLIGGGTTKVGDPSGKDESRKMLNDEMINTNINGISSVFKKFLTFGDGPTDAVVVNNDDWLSTLNYIDFLRSYGPMFSINRMVNLDSVRSRLERESPMTFLEFNYMILQAYDFVELHRRFNCQVQFGGSDQWGNIVGGIELARKKDQAHLFGLTAPLITTSDGKKMGKSAQGAIWLNHDLLSPFDYWQFWRNTADADVERFLKLFTELPLDKIAELSSLEGSDINHAKVVLADACTVLLHGADVLKSVKDTASSLFENNQSGGAGGKLEDLPRVSYALLPNLSNGVLLVDVMVGLNMAKSKSEARRLIKGGGARIDGVQIFNESEYILPVKKEVKEEESMKEISFKISAGKKRHGLLVFS